MEKREGIPRADGIKKIWLKDSKGLVVKNKPEGGINEHKEPFTQDHETMTDLGEMVKVLKPSVIIGAAAQAGVFTQEIIEDMARMNKHPVIFALSNPTDKAECTAEQAYKWSEGRAIFASGSPFPDYEMNGKLYKPGQGNNAYIFPGVALAAICCGLHHISDDVFLASAEALAGNIYDQYFFSRKIDRSEHFD